MENPQKQTHREDENQLNLPGASQEIEATGEGEAETTPTAENFPQAGIAAGSLAVQETYTPRPTGGVEGPLMQRPFKVGFKALANRPLPRVRSFKGNFAGYTRARYARNQQPTDTPEQQ